MIKRFICVALSLLLMLGCFYVDVPAYAVGGNEENAGLKVLYIPLDDRTLNDDQAVLMAKGMDITLMMPDRDLYSTKLDDGEKNSNGTQYGDRGKLFEYLMRNADQADILILSLDQLLSGGLMNSRCMEEMSTVTLSDGTEVTEYDIIDYIAQLAEEKPVYIIDSIERLASSNGFGGYDLVDYTLTRRYGKVARPVLTGEELTLENIIESYDVSEDGSDACLAAGFSARELAYFQGKADYEATAAVSADLETYAMDAQDFEGDVFAGAVRIAMPVAADSGNAGEETDNSLLARYLRVRQRKLRLLDHALRTLSRMENVHYLLGVDDSTEGNSIHVNEIAYAQMLMGENGEIFSALDGLFQTALTQAYRIYSGSGQVRVGVTYYGDDKEEVGGFNYQSHAQIIEKLIAYYNGVLVTEDPDISVLVYTSTDDAVVRNRNMLDLVSQINENEADHVPTILVDFSTSEGTQLKELYQDGIHMGMLLGYSGVAEGVNRIHMAISQGVGRYLYLVNTENPSQSAQEGFVESLLLSFSYEYYFTMGGRQEMHTYLEGVDFGDCFGMLEQDEIADIHQRLTEIVTEYTEGMMENFESSNYIASLKPYRLGSISNTEVESCWFPWLRQFEIGLQFRCTLSDQPRETVLHAWYTNGVTRDMFYPNELLTRQQSTKLLVMLSGIEPLDRSECAFADVDNWAKPYVAAAEKAGYVKGYLDGTFHGNASITRAEFSKMLVQYMEVEGITLEKKTTVTFQDVDRNGNLWYIDAVYLLADAGIIRGYKDGTFQPENQITRAEAVTMLNRFFGREEDMGTGFLQIQRFTDVPLSFWGYKAIQEACVTHFAN